VSACPTPEVLEAFVAGSLGSIERLVFERHLDGCANCGEVVAEMARLYGSELAAGTLGHAPTLIAGEALVAGREPAPPGGLTVGRYRLGQKLGAGGMGMVFEATDPELQRKVAVKLIHPGSSGDAEAMRERLLVEARAMAQLAHPNVVAVHDVGRAGEQIFIAMELVEGATLGAWLAEAPRSRAEVLAAFVAAGRGLLAAHRVGLVHRDFKPDNVLVGHDGRVRVTDFGLARAPRVVGVSATTVDARLTATGALVGTPAYMAPEQWAGEPTDARSDQFSFCVALYEALEGRPPFAGEELGTLARQVMAGEVRPLQRAHPRWLRRLLQRGLAMLPGDRFPSLAEIVAELAADRQRWRRVAAAAGAMAIGVAATVAVLVTFSGTTAAPEEPSAPVATDCSHIDRALNRAYSPATKKRLVEAYTSKAEGHAIVRPLDEWTATWRSAAERACIADAGPGVPTRSVCLDGQLDEFAALVMALSKHGARVRRQARAAIATLPRPEVCAIEAWPSPEARSEAAARAEDDALDRDRLALAATRRLLLLVDAEREAKLLLGRLKATQGPGVRAGALVEAGRVAGWRGDADAAATAFEQAAELAMQAGDERTVWHAARGLVLHRGVGQGRVLAVEREQRRLEETLLRVQVPLVALATRVSLAQLAMARGGYAEAAAQLEGKLDSVPAGPVLGQAWLTLSSARLALEEPRAAVEAAVRAREMWAALAGDDHLRLTIAEAALARARLSTALATGAKLDGAMKAARRALDGGGVGMSLRHDDVRGQAFDLLGSALARAGRLDEAREAFDKGQGNRYEEPPGAYARMARAMALSDADQAAEALAAAAEALVIAEKHHGKDDARLVPLLRAHARVLSTASRHAPAEQALERARSLVSASQGFTALVGMIDEDRGHVAAAAGNPRRALELFDKAHVPSSTGYGWDHRHMVAAVLRRADLAYGLGRKKYAGQLYRGCAGNLAEWLGPEHPDARRAAERRAPPPP
jgi:eukaryotic-like serine/threonine-protein kinase